MQNKNIVIFGGTGFIGSHFADFLLSLNIFDKVYLYDIKAIEQNYDYYLKYKLLRHPNLIYVPCDVRKPIINTLTPGSVEIIFNFAAIHREPGHDSHEYFDTNIRGAEHVCSFAEAVKCNSLIFTSSISPYGVGEGVKTEYSLPIPLTPYGSSKLVAEKIHQIWQARVASQRRLVIVRPGVVFGPGECGNVSRLIKSVLHKYFFYIGNKSVRKPGIYVKELCNALLWVYNRQKLMGENFTLFNMTMNPAPSISEYVEAVCKVAKIKRYIPNIPFFVLINAAIVIETLLNILHVNHPFSPVRIKKLVQSNNVYPSFLQDAEYKYEYTLETALADWKNCSPDEWK